MDFMGHPNKEFTFPQTNNEVMNRRILQCNKQNYDPTNQQNFDNPQPLAPTNKMYSTLVYDNN